MKAHPSPLGTRHGDAPAHRLVPTLLVGSWVLGTAAAIGHHFYYSFLDARIVQSQTQQEWYIRVGTGLAFLARALLSASLGFTYTQLMWRTLRTKAVTVDGVDAIFGLVGNIWNFRVWEIWRFGPGLVVVAMVIWALPLVAVVTPATLTVQLSARFNETIVDLAVPSVVYDSVSKFSYWQSQGRVLQGPSSRISRLLTAVASSGSVLPISNPQGHPNSSYVLDFHGPSIRCRQPENATFLEQVSNITDAYEGGGSANSFVAFVPTAAGTYNETAAREVGIYGSALDGLNETMHGTDVSRRPDNLDPNTAFDHARLYVVVPPWPAPFALINANTTIECGLYNTSYTANFTFNNGEQDVAWNKTQLNGVTSISATGTSSDGTVNSTQGTAYLSMFMALGEMLVGEVQSSHYGTISPLNTLVLNTVLSQTKELQVLQQLTGSSDPLTIANMSMADALEEVFTNATLSLFSDSYFLQNQSVASRSMTPVTVRAPQNEYHYEPRNLYIAYGSAVVAAALLAAAGLATIHAASASYGASFSTIVRTTRSADLDALVTPAASTGAEPNPRALAGARLLLRRGGGRPPPWTSFEVVAGPGGRAAKTASDDDDDGGGGGQHHRPGGSPSPPAPAKPGFFARAAEARRMSYDSLLQQDRGGGDADVLPPDGRGGYFREDLR